MAIPRGDKDGLFTYADYRSWPDDERWELIDGVAFSMSPAPTRRHQGILAELAAHFVVHFRSYPCSVYVAPFDVVLVDASRDAPHRPADGGGDTVVQPDLVVVCDATKLTPQGCAGAPDLVLEILSPATAFKDMEYKLHLYERHGVREYWIVNPANDTVMVYSVRPAGSSDEAAAAGTYLKPVLYTVTDTISPRLFPDLSIKLSDVFSRDRDQ